MWLVQLGQQSSPSDKFGSLMGSCFPNKDRLLIAKQSCCYEMSRREKLKWETKAVFYLIENGSVTAFRCSSDTVRKLCCNVTVCSFQGNSNTASKQPHYLAWWGKIPTKKGSSLPALWPGAARPSDHRQAGQGKALLITSEV